MVTMENYEEYLLLHADGELAEAEEKALEAFMTVHPELRKEMELYMATKLAPDTELVYEGREQLLKKPGRIIAWGQWRTYAAAASIIVLAILAVWKWQQPNTTNVTVVQVTNNNVNNYNTAPKDTVTRKQNATEKQLVNADEPIRNAAPPAQMHPKAQRYASVAKPVKRQEETLASIGISPVKPATTVAVDARPRQIDVTLPTIEMPDAQEGEKDQASNSLLARLPIKQEGLAEITNAVNSKIEKVKNIKDNIKNTDVSVRLWNKELFVVRL